MWFYCFYGLPPFSDSELERRMCHDPDLGVFLLPGDSHQRTPLSRLPVVSLDLYQHPLPAQSDHSWDRNTLETHLLPDSFFSSVFSLPSRLESVSKFYSHIHTYPKPQISYLRALSCPAKPSLPPLHSRQNPTPPNDNDSKMGSVNPEAGIRGRVAGKNAIVTGAGG